MPRRGFADRSLATSQGQAKTMLARIRKLWRPTALAALLLAACGLTGCQATIGGQTLPSAYYLEDDVQYFPAGPETRLPKLRQNLEEYRLEQQAQQDMLAEPAPVQP